MTSRLCTHKTMKRTGISNRIMCKISLTVCIQCMNSNEIIDVCASNSAMACVSENPRSLTDRHPLSGPGRVMVDLMPVLCVMCCSRTTSTVVDTITNRRVFTNKIRTVVSYLNMSGLSDVRTSLNRDTVVYRDHSMKASSDVIYIKHLTLRQFSLTHLFATSPTG